MTHLTAADLYAVAGGTASRNSEWWLTHILPVYGSIPVQCRPRWIQAACWHLVVVACGNALKSVPLQHHAAAILKLNPTHLSDLVNTRSSVLRRMDTKLFLDSAKLNKEQRDAKSRILSEINQWILN